MSVRSVLVSLLLACGLLVVPPASAWNADLGRVWRGDGVLRAGCHGYRYRYRVRPEGDDWMLELFLVGPGREGLGSDGKDSAVDPKRGRDGFRICRYTTRPGRFRIRGKLTIYPPDDANPLTEPPAPRVRWIEPARFRLGRAG